MGNRELSKSMVMAVVLAMLWSPPTTGISATSSGGNGSIAVTTNEWYVSPSGNDEGNGCSKATSPCQTVEQLPSRIKDGGRVHLSGTPNQTKAFLNCMDWNLTVLSNTLELLGNGSRPLFGCKDKPLQRFNLTFTAGGGGNVKLVLQNLLFQNVDVRFQGVHLELVQCQFENANLHLVHDREENLAGVSMEAVISHSYWQGSGDCLHLDDGHRCNKVIVRGNISRLHISNTQFLQYQLHITLTTDAQLTFDNIRFSNSPDMKSVLGGIYLLIVRNTRQTKVTLQNSILENQHHWDPIASFRNIDESAFHVRVGQLANNVTLVLHNCTFSKNERAVILNGPLDNTLVDSCVFESNKVMHMGGAIRISSMKHHSTFIRNCTFTNNAAGHIPGDMMMDIEGATFILDGDAVRINSSCCKGKIELLGIGGAIVTHRGDLRLENCSFVNNTARSSGGTLSVGSGNLYLMNCEFVNTPDQREISQHGDIIFSNADKVEINDIRVLVRSSSNHVSVLQHSGHAVSMILQDITVECPAGYGLHIRNKSSTRISREGWLQALTIFSYLSYFCKSCPRHKYSIDRGFLRFKADAKFGSGYYSLKFNGETPQPAHLQLYEFRDIRCKECPYGGNCDDHLRALPNFWGYDQGGDITFQLCPSGYCCPVAPCTGYNSCAQLRTGLLCGTCLDGYTEAMYSTKCVPDEDCGQGWMWAFVFSTGVLYTLLLLFQDDIRDFIFVLPKHIIECQQSDPTIPRFHKSGSDSGTIYVATNTNDIGNMCDPACDKETSAPGETSVAKECKHTQPKTDIGEALLIIVMYYFQDAMLFQIKTPFAELQVEEHSLLQKVLLSLFDFQIDVSPFVDNACLVPGFSPSQKLLVLSAFVPYVLLLFGFLYTFHAIWTNCAGNPTSRPSMFITRLSVGFMLSILFMYQQLATSAFTLLNCVPVGGHNVLFIEGPVRCYQIWQYVVMAYVAVAVVPFFAVLLWGPGLLQEGRVGLRSFFLACLFPLPFVVYWISLRLRKNIIPANDFQMPADCESVVNVLQGPFKAVRIPRFGPICWAGVEIFRRFVLVILFTFVAHSLVRVISMLVTCFLVFVLHMQVKPYKDKMVNALGSMSTCALMIVGGINFVYAGFETAEYTPQGPNKKLIYVMQNSESILLLWFPLVIMSIILLALVLKTVYVIAKGLRKFLFPGTVTVEL